MFQCEQEIEVREHSLARLVKMAWDNRRDILLEARVGKLMVRHRACGYDGQRPWVHQLVSDLVPTKYFVGRAVTLSAQLVSGTAPTGEWLHRHGWKTSGRCACGQWDSMVYAYKDVHAAGRLARSEE